MHTIEPIARAVEAFASLPGIGPKTAQRLTFHLLRQPADTVRGLAEAILHMQEAVHFCSVCGNVTDVEPCSICRSDQRDRSTICVVEDPLAVMTLERTRIYKGLYHVLHGALDPLHGVTVECTSHGWLAAYLLGAISNTLTRSLWHVRWRVAAPCPEIAFS